MEYNFTLLALPRQAVDLGALTGLGIDLSHMCVTTLTNQSILARFRLTRPEWQGVLVVTGNYLSTNGFARLPGPSTMKLAIILEV